MPGFFAQIGIEQNRTEQNRTEQNIFKKIKTFPGNQKNKHCDFISSHNIYIERYTNLKFFDDKVLFEDDNYIILLEGVVLNSKSLIAKYGAKSLKDCIIRLYNELGQAFFDVFRGSYCGILADKRKGLTIIFSDHIGSKPVYYSKIENDYIFTTDLLYLLEYYKYKNIPLSIDINAAYYILTMGMQIENNTLFDEIKRITPGCYAVMTNNNLEEKSYFTLDFEPFDVCNEDELIEQLDTLFANAVKLQFEKDKEYGYKHICTLSAGLDSRMTTFIARKSGYDILNLTFSQSGYLDATVPPKIAEDLKNEWIFKALDNGIYLKDIERNVLINCGMTRYCASAHGMDFLDLINFEPYGMIHTGQLGDEIIGSVIHDIDMKFSKDYYDIMKSPFFDIKKRIHFNPKNAGEYYEAFWFPNRCFSSTNQGLTGTFNYTETMSPFYDVDFIRFCFKIPLELRIHHALYFKWILKKHPEAAQYVWEKTKARIDEKEYKIFGARVPKSRIPRFLYVRLLKKIAPNKAKGYTYSIETKDNMNPFEYWYNNNSDLKNIYDCFYTDNIHLLNAYDTLSIDCKNTYQKGNAAYKNAVITLLELYKNYVFR